MIKYMSLLLETIKVKDGEYLNLFYHEQRMNDSLRALRGAKVNVDLEKLLAAVDAPKEGLFKCRILYDVGTKEVEFSPYKARPIQTLRVIEDDQISYEFKYSDRSAINYLFAKRKDCDDILIAKRGFVTDSSVANIVFKRNKTWYTPHVPLLKGTMRAKLLERKVIQEEEVRIKDIYNFESFKLINAMLEFDSQEHEITNIVF